VYILGRSVNVEVVSLTVGVTESTLLKCSIVKAFVGELDMIVSESLVGVEFVGKGGCGLSEPSSCSDRSLLVELSFSTEVRDIPFCSGEACEGGGVPCEDCDLGTVGS
jgi:hypothetical protein